MSSHVQIDCLFIYKLLKLTIVKPEVLVRLVKCFSSIHEALGLIHASKLSTLVEAGG